MHRAWLRELRDVFAAGAEPKLKEWASIFPDKDVPENSTGLIVYRSEATFEWFIVDRTVRLLSDAESCADVGTATLGLDG